MCRDTLTWAPAVQRPRSPLLEPLDPAPRLVGALPVRVGRVLLRVAQAAARTAAPDVVELVREASADDVRELVPEDPAREADALGDDAIGVEAPAGSAGAGRHGGSFTRTPAGPGRRATFGRPASIAARAAE